MRLTRSLPALLLLAALPAHAADPTAAGLPDTFIKALRGHDMATLDRLITDDAAITVVWTDPVPAQRFTLAKAEYLQQQRALWRFGTRESYELSPSDRTAETGPDSGTVSLVLTEKRFLFGKPAGQRSDLRLHVRREGPGWRIDAIRAHLSLW